MSNTKNSAVSEDPVDVLVVLHNKFDLLDFAAVTEVLTTALHDKNDPSECFLAYRECLPAWKYLLTRHSFLHSF